jgi:hypothetical protein
MQSIDAVTITAQSAVYSRGAPAPDSPTFLWVKPGSVRVAVWQAGILSLDRPDGAHRRILCLDVAEAVRRTMKVWDTPVGHAAVARRMAEKQRQYEAATWTGERRYEWQEPKQLVALVKAEIRRAVKDGILPMPNDYRVTWRSDDRAIYIHTLHALLPCSPIVDTLHTLIQPFNASTAGNCDGAVSERWDFDIEVESPRGPKKDQTLPWAERMALEGAHLAAAMERAGFPADDIGFVRDLYAAYASDAE